jgi:type II secretory pathway component PulF
MNGRIARGLSWGAAVLCAHYIGWECYYLKRVIPVLAQLLSGLGGELPTYTRFVIALSNHALSVGSLLILLVVGKELVIRDTMIRLEFTFIVFL